MTLSALMRFLLSFADTLPSSLGRRFDLSSIDSLRLCIGAYHHRQGRFPPGCNSNDYAILQQRAYGSMMLLPPYEVSSSQL
ncbi:hypothetical protein EV127DRAFT_450104 [Xylaria flabelliformis]|nr:hypothetical protein EV127DRAFT_450104 [Xylaria flabelliformis]